MRLYLVRHGDTEIGQDRLYGEDAGLTELGRQQSEAAAHVLAPLEIENVFTSSLRRALESAAPLTRLSGVEPIAVPGLDEVRIGHLRQAPIEAITQRIYTSAPKADFSEFGGENAAEFSERVLYALARDVIDRCADREDGQRLNGMMASEAGDGNDEEEKAVIYAHGGTLSVILDYAEGVRFNGDLHRKIPNGSISLVTVEGRQLRVVHGPDAHHLQEVGITQMHGTHAGG